MKDIAEKTTSNGVGFLGMLFLLFLGLKLSDKIDWSWWWVFAPLWVPVVLIVAIVGIVAIVLAIQTIVEKRK